MASATTWPDLVSPTAAALAVVLPFEIIRPLVVTPWLSVTDEKLALLALAVAWLLTGARALPTSAEWRTMLPSIALAVIAGVTAVAAPDFGDDALKFVWRFAAAAFVGLVAMRLSANGKAGYLLWAITAGAGVSGLLGLAEVAGWHALDPLFSLFKVAPTRVGGELRVSGSFQYATIASMYFEMVTPLALALAATSRQVHRVLAIAIATVCAANVALSLTRAGIITLALMLAIAAVVAARRHQNRMPILATAGVLIGVVGLLARSNAVFDMRLTTESDADWYGAAYIAPAQLQLTPGQLSIVELDVYNEGRIPWSDRDPRHPFELDYRWLSADGEHVLDVPSGAVALTGDVAPGESIRLTAPVTTPDLPNGSYRLDWGMVQRDVVQFYERGWANVDTNVTVVNSSVTTPPRITERDDEEAPWVVGRLELWGAGLRLALARPLLGYGPDNFRHFYGTQLGLDSWDERVQANNLYLELLVDLGVFGLLAFIWQVVPLTVRTLRRASTSWISLGLGLGLLAFLVHGLLDSFLAFTPTAVLFWMLLGIASQKPQVSGR